jgi:hypothetical protein
MLSSPANNTVRKGEEDKAVRGGVGKMRRRRGFRRCETRSRVEEKNKRRRKMWRE